MITIGSARTEKGKTMSEISQCVKCDHCSGLIDVSTVEILQQIVSKDFLFKVQDQKIKKKMVAVKYYFLCPHCGAQYDCFYKDSNANKLLAANRIDEANAYMDKLWELFEDVS